MLNVPNTLSLLRLLLIPVFVVVLFSGVPGAYYYAAGIFLLASLTDILDGYIARKYNQITKLGRFLDPAAVAQYRNKPFRDFVHETWLSILDGRGKGVGDEAYQKLVLGVADALVQVRTCKLTLDIRQALRNIITADYFDNAVI